MSNFSLLTIYSIIYILKNILFEQNLSTKINRKLIKIFFWRYRQIDWSGTKHHMFVIRQTWNTDTKTKIKLLRFQMSSKIFWCYTIYSYWFIPTHLYSHTLIQIPILNGMSCDRYAHMICKSINAKKQLDNRRKALCFIEPVLFPWFQISTYVHFQWRHVFYQYGSICPLNSLSHHVTLTDFDAVFKNCVQKEKCDRQNDAMILNTSVWFWTTMRKTIIIKNILPV